MPMRKNMRVVVTGAAGFIGSSVCEALLAKGSQVLGIDAFTDSYNPDRKKANLAELLDHPKFQLVDADLTLADLRTLLEPGDAVVHLAAESRESASWGSVFSRYVERNVLATQRLLEAAQANMVRRFIYASSSAVYGDARRPSRETSTPRPITPYGVSKLAGEHLAGLHAAQGLPAVILRFFSIYGPRQRPDMAVHRFIEEALDGRPFTVYGDGRQVRDLTFVGDAVSATLSALTAPLEPGTILNVAGGHRVCVRDLAAKVGELVGADGAGTVNEPARDGDVRRREASISAAASQLEWRPLTDLDTGLSQQVEWQAGLRMSNRPFPQRANAPAPARSHGPRLMIYTQDGLGLGHLRRASSVATEFLQREPSGWVLTTSDSPLGTLLRDVPNHDYLKLPSIVKSGSGEWRPLSSPLDFAHLRQLRSRLILEAASAFRPDVLLVDHMPHGAMGELLPTLESMRGGATSIVLGLRDIIDAPEVVHQRWQDEGAFDALAQHFDDVLIYGSQEVFDLCKEYRWPSQLADLVQYCGYLCTPEVAEDPKRIRARRLAGVPRGALIVAMAGGGADAHELMSTLLDALPEIHATNPCVLELVTGPFMPDSQRLDLKRRAQSLPVRLRTMVRNPLSRVAAADLVVAMAGYNTTMEILRLGTPALLVPRRGPSKEQRLRAQRFAERCWVAQLDPDKLTPRRLASAVLDALSPESRPLPMSAPDLGGLSRAVEHLLTSARSTRSRERRSRDVSLTGRSRLPGAVSGR
jgi:predicted glycosyltransferase/nucleoside-diphosphate-sugar epimerase